MWFCSDTQASSLDFFSYIAILLPLSGILIDFDIHDVESTQNEFRKICIYVYNVSERICQIRAFCNCCAKYNGIGGCGTFCYVCCCTSSEFNEQCDRSLPHEICCVYLLCSFKFIPCGQCLCNLALYQYAMADYKDKYKHASHEILSWFDFLCMPAWTACFLLMMMIAFITIKSSLVPLIEGLCAQIYFRFEISVVCSHLLLFFFVKEKTC